MNKHVCEKCKKVIHDLRELVITSDDGEESPEYCVQCFYKKVEKIISNPKEKSTGGSIPLIIVGMLWFMLLAGCIIVSIL